MNRISKHTITKMHPPTMSNVSFTIHTPLQRTLPKCKRQLCGLVTYCMYWHIGLQYQSNPTSLKHSLSNFSGLILTSTTFDQCGILNLYLLPFYSHSPCTLLPHINITVLVNGPTHWPCPLCTISPSNFPNWKYHHYLTCPVYSL